MSMSAHEKEHPNPPGNEIQRMLEARNLSQADFADIVGYSEKQLSQIVTGTAPITLDFALRLERTLGESAEEWLRKETEYRLGIEKEKQEKELRRIRIKNDIYGRMPIREMVKLGWIDDPGRDVGKLVEAVKGFWNIRDFDLSFMDSSPAMMMRSSEAYQAKFNPNYAATWLHKAQNVASEREISSCFDKDGIMALGFSLPSLSIRPDGEEEAMERLSGLGVITVDLPHLPQTYLDGAAFMSGTHPVVAFTRRMNRIDNFWFVLAHELAHVCLHLAPSGCGGTVFMDCDEPAAGDKEGEANALAGEFLKHREIREYFSRRRIKRETIVEFAKEAGIHPGVVVGFLQHIRFLPYYSFNDLKAYRSEVRGKTTAASGRRPRKTDGGRRTSRMR